MRDERGDAAIKILNPRLQTRTTGAGQGYVWAKHREGITYSCYFSPNREEEEFEEFLSSLESSVRNNTHKEKRIVIAGDFNAKAQAWGSPITDRRGELVLDMAASLNLIVINTGRNPTFQREGTSSYIDITLATQEAAARIEEWTILEEETLSYHNYIYCKIQEMLVPMNSGRKGWHSKHIDVDKLQRTLRRYMHEDIRSPKELTNILTKVCDSTMKRRGRKNYTPVYWWTSGIAELRKQTLAARRQLTRARKKKGITDCEKERDILREMKTQLRKDIEKSKKRCWENLCAEVDENPWGDAYKIVMQRLRSRGAPEIMLRKDTMEVVSKLFPPHPVTNWITTTENLTAEIPPVTKEEFHSAIAKLKKNRAPGPDGIPPEILKETEKLYPEEMRTVFNKIMETGKFPKDWKKARLVLIRKAGKEPGKPEAYRPLCLLDAMAKVMEHLIHQRLSDEINRNEGLAENQFGFRKGRSAIGALREVTKTAEEAKQENWRKRKICILVTLDVRNAFNSASWRRIVGELRRRNIPKYLVRIVMSYFNERQIITESQEGTEIIKVSAGVPQGSVLGPLLWNILYDGALRLKTPQGTKVIAYADDLAVVATSRSVEELEYITNGTLEKVTEWMSEMGLEIAAEKTMVTVLAGRRRAQAVKIKIAGQNVQVGTRVKYLGVTLDPGGYYPHIRAAADKATRTISTLERIMPKTGGPKQCKRKLLGSVAQSVMLYAAPIWANALSKERNRKALAKVQRRIALRICCAYRTISEEAVLVIAGTPPIDLVAFSRARGERGKEAKDWILQAWQERWETATKGAWTRRLIPNLKPWVERKHGQVGYHLTQILAGHGCFRSYLKRFKKSQEEWCTLCWREEDSALHTFFRCEKWTQRREELEKVVGTLDPDTCTSKMVEKEEYWNAIERFAVEIITHKEQVEKTEQVTRPRSPEN